MGRKAESDGVPGAVVVVCGAAVVACSLFLLVTNASLVGDGSSYLLRAVQTGQPFQLSGRQLTNLVREGPLLLGLASGITNTHSLTLLQGVGFLLLPALVWTLALVHARGSRVHFTLVAISCGLCFATMIIFSASELTLTLPLVVLVSVLLARSVPWSGPNAILVVLSTGLTFLSHESIAPCAAVLVVQAVLRAQRRLGVMDSRVSVAVATLSVIVLAGAVWTLVFRPNSNSADFLKDLETLNPLSMVALIMGAACLLGWVALYGHADPEWLRWPLLVPATVLTLLGIKSAIHTGPGAAYSARGFCVIIVVVLQVLLLIDWLRPQWMESRNLVPTVSQGGVLGATAFLVIVMVIPIVYAARWSSVIGEVRVTITDHAGVVPSSDVRTPLATTYLWAWTNPTLSLVLRSSSRNAVVENRDPSLGPFGATSAETQIPSAFRWGG
jgi:hypothetical protein